ncbi:MAG: hypothetical protein WBM78_22645 [Desulfobacterales bacterium]
MRKSLFLQEFTSGGFLHIRKNETFSLSLHNVTIIFTCFYATMGSSQLIAVGNDLVGAVAVQEKEEWGAVRFSLNFIQENSRRLFYEQNTFHPVADHAADIQLWAGLGAIPGGASTR